VSKKQGFLLRESKLARRFVWRFCCLDPPNKRHRPQAAALCAQLISTRSSCLGLWLLGCEQKERLSPLSPAREEKMCFVWWFFSLDPPNKHHRPQAAALCAQWISARSSCLGLWLLGCEQKARLSPAQEEKMCFVWWFCCLDPPNKHHRPQAAALCAQLISARASCLGFWLLGCEQKDRLSPAQRGEKLLCSRPSC